MNLIKQLEWRYATKLFDAKKKVSAGNIKQLQRAIQLSASSYGLQLYKVIIINDLEIREQLRHVSWNQMQITDASHLFVFCNYTSIKDSYIDNYIDLVSRTRSLDKADLTEYADFMKNKLAEKSPPEQKNWLERQPYLALGNLLVACAELGIDACPMEGFEPQGYNDILNLGSQGLHACVIAAIGYRSDKDYSQFKKKVRKPVEEMFDTIEYCSRPIPSMY